MCWFWRSFHRGRLSVFLRFFKFPNVQKGRERQNTHKKHTNTHKNTSKKSSFNILSLNFLGNFGNLKKGRRSGSRYNIFEFGVMNMEDVSTTTNQQHEIHPGRLTWNLLNLLINHLERKNDLPNLHGYVPAVNLPGCIASCFLWTPIYWTQFCSTEM